VYFQVHRADLDVAAEQMIGDVDASRHWPDKTVTKISEAVVSWEMEPDDQD
jgi:peptide-methionine (S)-S-oxide reductase